MKIVTLENLNFYDDSHNLNDEKPLSDLRKEGIKLYKWNKKNKIMKFEHLYLLFLNISKEDLKQ